jgi:hypothetical protein
MTMASVYFIYSFKKKKRYSKSIFIQLEIYFQSWLLIALGILYNRHVKLEKTELHTNSLKLFVRRQC